MEVHFTAETEKKLQNIAMQSGLEPPMSWCGTAKCSTAVMTT